LDETASGFQSKQKLSWISSFQFSLGLDGLSVYLVILLVFPYPDCTFLRLEPYTANAQSNTQQLRIIGKDDKICNKNTCSRGKEITATLVKRGRLGELRRAHVILMLSYLSATCATQS